MSNLNEVARTLRKIEDGICCLRGVIVSDGSFNSDSQLQIDDGGINPATKTFAIGSFHSLSWSVMTGSVDVTINGVTVEYPTGSGGGITESTLNDGAVVFTIVTGSTVLLWK